MGKDLKGKELSAGISQRKDGLYTARFTDRNGKRRQRYFKKLQECRKWIADARFEDEHSDINAVGDMSVSAWFDYWIENFKTGNVKQKTIQNYKDRFRLNIKPCMGDMMLSDVKPLHCQNVLNMMAKDGYCTSTIKLSGITMRTLFGSAVENGLIMKNPVSSKSDHAKGAESKPKRVLTIGEQRSFLNAVDGKSNYNQYALVLQTGIRTGELAALTWEDVDFEKRMLHIRKTADDRSGKWDVRSPKSKAGIRAIPLNDEALRILKNQKEKMRSLAVVPLEYHDHVFLSGNGNLIKNSTYNKDIRRICKTAGIAHFSMHTLRHTFATRCAEAGMQPKTLQTILGHSNISITMDIYVHCTEDKKHNEMNEVAAKLKVV